MLRKLLNYEFKATGRIFLLFFIAMVALAGINRLFMEFNLFEQRLAIIPGITVGLYVMMIFATFVLTFVVMIQRFYKNLLGDEGYLMFTLPVSSRQLLWSKAIPAFVWRIGTVITVAVSVLLLCWTPAATQSLLRVFREYASPEGLFLMEQWFPRFFQPFFWLLFPIVTVIDAFSGLFMLYAAMAIGHTVRRHKIWASIGAYFAISMVIGMATSILTSALLPGMTRGFQQLPEEFVTQAEMLRFADVVGELINGTMLLSLVISAVSLVALYLLAQYLLDTQLNLE